MFHVNNNQVPMTMNGPKGYINLINIKQIVKKQYNQPYILLFLGEV